MLHYCCCIIVDLHLRIKTSYSVFLCIPYFLIEEGNHNSIVTCFYMGYWLSLFRQDVQVLSLCVYGQRWNQDLWTCKKERMKPISRHLDWTGLVNKGFILWVVNCGQSWAGKTAPSFPTQVANHRTGFGSSCLLRELAGSHIIKAHTEHQPWRKLHETS